MEYSRKNGEHFFNCFQRWIAAVTKGLYKNSLSIIIIVSNEFSTFIYLIEINSLDWIKDNFLIALIFFLFVCTKISWSYLKKNTETRDITRLVNSE